MADTGWCDFAAWMGDDDEMEQAIWLENEDFLMEQITVE